MNLESDKRLIQLRLDFSSAPTGEARRARREDIESLSVVSEPQSPTNTLCLERVSATSRTAVYGPVRTVVWEGRSREAPLSGSLARSRHADERQECPLIRVGRKWSTCAQNVEIDPAPSGHAVATGVILSRYSQRFCYYCLRCCNCNS